ncbi:YqjF family protein [Planococcus lenghuensis]|uniref:DUF2071 domain-containing protein n=1 Tax=Planococcus lenghuensis TaxID=2213202 RepID=A0A1Q2L1Z7_9BACL|nr:DUF2071 domain-containing protein [Planococcus lenghuensis]AQQ54436.1 hypothetical protein B0X71_15895 [Planococcus lenghuensis]
METAWIMTQEWHDLTFFHWPIDPEYLRPHIPGELELDLFNGQAWLSVVPFEARETCPRYMPPVPGGCRYLELNVRTYVRYGGRSGVYFFSLDADSRPIVWTAGMLLPYRRAAMDFKRAGCNQRFSSERVHKGCFPERFGVDYTAMPKFINRSSLDIWLTERYSLWTKPARQLIRVDIRHESWKLQPVTYNIRCNSLAAFIRTDWRGGEPLAHYSKFEKVWFYPPVIERIM